VELLEDLISLKENREGERSNSREVFGKEEGNSYKYECLIAITLECNDFINNYDEISIIFI
jgi:hypothetical protein